MTFCHTLQIHCSYHSKIKSVLWSWRQSILMNLTNAGSPSHGTSCTHYWRNWIGGVFSNHSTYHKYYRSTNTLVDYFRWTFITFLHYNCTIILIHQHSMDSSHHHPHSTPKLVAFFEACKSPGSSDVLGCKGAARHRQQLCDYCTSAKHPHCLHLQSGTCHTGHQQHFDLIGSSHFL